MKPPLDVWRERIGYIVAYGVGHTQVISWREDVSGGMMGREGDFLCIQGCKLGVLAGIKTDVN